MRGALDDMSAALARAVATQMDVRASIAQGLAAAAPSCSAPITEHRRQHRSGRAPKIENDPELRAFILARIDRLTFPQIADDVAEHFEESRRVRKTAIWDWYRKTYRRK